MNALTSASTALQVLRMFVTRDQIGVGDVSRELGISRSAAYRCLLSLEAERFVMLSPSGRGYGPGPDLVAFSEIPAITESSRRRWAPILRTVRDDLGESVHSSVLVGNQVLVTEGRRSVHSEDMGSRIGMTSPAHAMAAGKLLLAALDDRLVRAIMPTDGLSPRTPRTVVDIDVLLEQLAGVRRDGFACAIQESEVGIDSVAVPLDGSSFRDRAALVISAPSERGGRPRLRRLGIAAREIIAAASDASGVSPWEFRRRSTSSRS